MNSRYCAQQRTETAHLALIRIESAWELIHKAPPTPPLLTFELTGGGHPERIQIAATTCPRGWKPALAGCWMGIRRIRSSNWIIPPSLAKTDRPSDPHVMRCAQRLAFHAPRVVCACPWPRGMFSQKHNNSTTNSQARPCSQPAATRSLKKPSRGRRPQTEVCERLGTHGSVGDTGSELCDGVSAAWLMDGKRDASPVRLAASCVLSASSLAQEGAIGPVATSLWLPRAPLSRAGPAATCAR